MPGPNPPGRASTGAPVSSGTELDWGATAVIATDVRAEELEGEMLILDLATSEYYSLNDVGTTMWMLMSEGRSLERVAAEVCARYEVAQEQVRADLAALVTELEGKGLISVRSVSAPARTA